LEELKYDNALLVFSFYHIDPDVKKKWELNAPPPYKVLSSIKEAKALGVRLAFRIDIFVPADIVRARWHEARELDSPSLERACRAAVRADVDDGIRRYLERGSARLALVNEAVPHP
jgi:DNA repair photolyase